MSKNNTRQRGNFVVRKVVDIKKNDNELTPEEVLTLYYLYAHIHLMRKEESKGLSVEEALKRGII